MNIKIRAIRIEDIEDIYKLRVMPGVMENTLGILSYRRNKTEEFIKNLNDNDHVLVAELKDNSVKKVVGMVGLSINRSPRMRHSANIGISVKTDYQNKGIGKMLLNEILEIADKWLMLERTELEVYIDNEKAINLYKSFGFEIEGTKRESSIRNGQYIDDYIMGRLRP